MFFRSVSSFRLLIRGSSKLIHVTSGLSVCYILRLTKNAEMEKLLLTVMMLSNGQDWITVDVQNCIRNITETYFFERSLLHIGETGIKAAFQSSKMAYTDVSQKDHHFDTVMIHRNLSKWKKSELRGKVLLITQTLDGINILWTSLRLLNLVVLLVDEKVIKLYTWFPYNHKYCRGEPPLLLTDTWHNGSFAQKTNLFPLKIPKNFKGCPLVTTKGNCEPFSFISGTTSYGMEPNIVRIIVSSINAREDVLNMPPKQYYKYKLPNGSYSGLFWLLSERKVDLAGGCLTIAYEKSLVADNLPPHMDDYLTWYLPGPVPKSLAYGFATCLEDDIWLATAVTFIAVYGLFILIFPSSMSSSFIWTFARFMGLTHFIKIPLFLEIFGILLDLMLLILTSLYRSSLLMNLFYAPMDAFYGPEDALDRGLQSILRTIHQYLYNSSNHDLWNRILVPGRYEITFDYPYQKIVDYRTHMGLGLFYLDQAFIRTAYPNRSFQDIVTVAKPYFYSTRMAIHLPLSHPLIELLTDRMARIIESGLPTFLIWADLNSLQGRPVLKDSTQKPLALKHLLTVFFLHLSLLIGTTVIFICELVYCYIGKQKQGDNKRTAWSLRGKWKRCADFGQIHINK